MRPHQTRRLLVFVVCALGVSAMYVVPAFSPTPRVAERLTPSRPSTVTSTLDVAEASRPVSSSGPVAPVTAQLEQTTDRARPSDSTPEPPRTTAPQVRPQRQRATHPVGGDRRRDRDRPAAVASVQVDEVTPDTVTIHWVPTDDDVAVVGYQVWLNGFQVASTSELSATLDWFNDDMGQHVLQVRAVDAAGNESETSPSVLVTRPTPAPSDPPTEPPVADTTPAPTPSAESPEPTTDPTSQPSTGDRPTSRPSESDPPGETP